jgi:hypothetical protein
MPEIRDYVASDGQVTRAIVRLEQGNLSKR